MIKTILKDIKKKATDKTKKFSRQFTTHQFLKEILSQASTNEKVLENNINNGHWLASYIPFVKNKTGLILGNFLSVNYGIRDEINLLVGLVDCDFNVKKGKLFKLNLREILVLKEAEINELTSDDEIEYCVVCAINSKIPKNRGENELRFWGTWSKYSAFVHAMPLPNSINFLRQNFKKLKNIPLERMHYPHSSNEVFHFGPLTKKFKIKERGDLSGKLHAQYGYTVFLDHEKNITSCFHNAPFNRENRLTSLNNSWIKHVIPFPPLENIDIKLFFGEACSNGSIFLASLFEKNNIHSMPVCLQEKKITINISESFTVSKIFDKEISSKNDRWLVLTPLEGLHDIGHISIFYENAKDKRCFDAIHSQSFKNNPKEKERLLGKSKRTLKFAPFTLSRENINYSFLVVLGEWQNDINIRIRVFSADNPNFEILITEKIPCQEVKYINLVEKLGLEYKEGSLNNTFLCQIESEEANLDGYFINALEGDNGISKLAIDHLTGG